MSEPEPTGWEPWNQPIDYVLVGGVRTPGIAEVSGGDDERTLKIGYPHGKSGGIVKYLGTPLSTFTVTLRLHEADEWHEWKKFRAEVLKAPDRRHVRFFRDDPKVNEKITKHEKPALDVVHPLLAEQGIRAAVVKKIHTPSQNSTGVWTIVIDFLEVRGTKETNSKIVGSKSHVKGDPPEDWADKIVKGLTGQLQETAAS